MELEILVLIRDGENQEQTLEKVCFGQWFISKIGTDATDTMHPRRSM